MIHRSPHTDVAGVRSQAATLEQVAQPTSWRHLTRRTKIVATLGPATDAPGVLDALVSAGLDCARLNCSHGTQDDIRRRAAQVREAAGAAGRPIAVMLDLQGPKIRLAQITPRLVSAGEELVFSAVGPSARPGDVGVELDGFDRLVSQRSRLVIGDGSPRFSVDGVNAGRVHARALTSGPLLPRKGISVTDATPVLPAITTKDLADLDLAVELDVDFVAQSFVRSAADVQRLRAALADRGSGALVIAKVEKVEAAARIEEILATSDGVMVARGDYGVEAGVEQVPLMQKHVIRRALEVGKLAVTATQMLESMLVNAEPTRAEASDVANAVIDGTSAVMLSGETSVGDHPVGAVAWMARIAESAEQSRTIAQANSPESGEEPEGAVMHAAVELALQTGAAALVVPTSTGASVRACSRYRPPMPIVAIAHETSVAMRLALEWGVIPTTVPCPATVGELIDAAVETAATVAGLPPGATVVLTAGTPGARGTTNLILVREIPSR